MATLTNGLRAVLAVAMAVSCSRKEQPSIALATAAASSQAVPSASSPSNNPSLDALHAWDDAHNRHDVDALRKLYAPTVDFYGQKLSRDKVIAAKSLAFVSTPDFKQVLSDIHIVAKNDAGHATFRKTWTSTGTTRSVDASLDFQTINQAVAIISESDKSVGVVPSNSSAQPTVTVAQLTEQCAASGPTLSDWRACADLAERYEDGDGVPKDISRATELAKRVCDTGVTGMRFPDGRNFCYGFSAKYGIKPPLGCCYEAPPQ